MNIDNIDIKDLVLVGGGLFTVAIIFHGIWLAWRSRQEPLRLDISPDLIPEDDDELVRLRGELPNGGGRPVRPVQKDLEFDQPVPILLDPVEAPAVVETAVPESAADLPPWPAAEAPRSPVPESAAQDPGPIRAEFGEPKMPETGPIVAQASNRTRFAERREPEKTPRESRQAPADSGSQELLVINLFARGEEQFTGTELVAAMRAQGLNYGEMDIFHRLDPATREVQFSVASVVEPGYFNLAALAELLSPGLVFFLQLAGLSHPAEVVEDMLRVSRAIAEELGAVLKDENMNELTGQREEHYRECAADFSRRRLSRRVGVA